MKNVKEEQKIKLKIIKLKSNVGTESYIYIYKINLFEKRENIFFKLKNIEEINKNFSLRSSSCWSECSILFSLGSGKVTLYRVQK